MTVRDVLLKAAELCERGWCQGVSSRNDKRYPCCPHDPMAVEWCAGGAITRGADGDPVAWRRTMLIAEASLLFLEVISDWSVSGWNDATIRSKREVVSALRRAADQAGESE